MEPKKRKIDLIPEHFFCVHCLVTEDEYITADILMWDKDEKKIYPLCAQCKAIIDGKKKFFEGFSMS